MEHKSRDEQENYSRRINKQETVGVHVFVNTVFAKQRYLNFVFGSRLSGNWNRSITFQEKQKQTINPKRSDEVLLM